MPKFILKGVTVTNLINKNKKSPQQQINNGDLQFIVDSNLGLD